METYELVFVVLGTSVIFGLLGISIGQYLAHEEVKRYIQRLQGGSKWQKK